MKKSVIKILENLPMTICYEDNLYEKHMHVTAWGKLCLCYYTMYKVDDELKRTIFSEVVNKNHKGDGVFTDNPIQIVDVSNLTDAIIMLEKRFNEALKKDVIKVYFQNMSKERFSVWVGGIEVNDYYLSKEQAKNLAKAYKKDGYDDVKIVDNKN